MIKNRITFWRLKMNRGRGISQAELARRVRVGRSFVTKLEKNKAQPGGELMLRFARVLKRPVENIFWLTPSIICAHVIPVSQIDNFASALAEPVCKSTAAPPARPVGQESVTDKSPVGPAAKAVAPPVAW
jgi:DNA-binding XRE family transcriptional regulator